MYGLKQSDYQFIDQHVIQPLKQKGAKVWVFGSRARGDHQQFSDLDLYIECESDIDRFINDLNELLEESDLPIKVDLVQDKHFVNSYRESMTKDRIIWP